MRSSLNVGATGSAKIAAETYVLDAWAILALLDGDEPVATRIEELLDTERQLMSWVNLGEVYYRVHRQHGRDRADEIVRDLRPRLDLETPTEARVLEAARLKAERRLGFADSFVAATAIAHRATILTGDPDLLVEDAPWRAEDLRA